MGALVRVVARHLAAAAAIGTAAEPVTAAAGVGVVSRPCRGVAGAAHRAMRRAPRRRVVLLGRGRVAGGKAWCWRRAQASQGPGPSLLQHVAHLPVGQHHRHHRHAAHVHAGWVHHHGGGGRVRRAPAAEVPAPARRSPPSPAIPAAASRVIVTGALGRHLRLGHLHHEPVAQQRRRVGLHRRRGVQRALPLLVVHEAKLGVRGLLGRRDGDALHGAVGGEDLRQVLVVGARRQLGHVQRSHGLAGGERLVARLGLRPLHRQRAAVQLKARRRQRLAGRVGGVVVVERREAPPAVVVARDLGGQHLHVLKAASHAANHCLQVFLGHVLAQVSQKQAVLDLGDDYPHGLGPGVRGQHLAPQLLDGVRGGLLGVVHGKRKPFVGVRDAGVPHQPQAVQRTHLLTELADVVLRGCTRDASQEDLCPMRREGERVR
mmetsp:Transcript_28190/g.72427  ORF Transcript_28190/g.72427 Transcript_28190/m.72427 type:complete len:432 (-) Transcript_28190:498-1793(-)